MKVEEVQKLAKMMRMEIGVEEAESIGRDMDAVIHYIDNLSEIDVSNVVKEKPLLFNITREDVAEHESDMYTEKILEGTPNTENGFVKVKKVM